MSDVMDVIFHRSENSRSALMASKQKMTDILGIHLLAAELSRLGFIVAPAPRYAPGADLFVTDHKFSAAWTVQVKTNGKRKYSWPLSDDFKRVQSDSHVYVFVKLNGEQRPDYYVVSSRQVANDAIARERCTGTSWRSYPLNCAQRFRENWTIFGNPEANVHTALDISAQLEVA